MAGMILPPAEADYGDAEKLGRVTIEYDQHAGATVHVDGFVFDEAGTCRVQVTKAMAWARDVLAAAIDVSRLAPGGGVQVSAGMSQDELELRQAKAPQS